MRIVENRAARLALRDRTLWVTWICAPAACVLLIVALSRHDWRPAVTGALFALSALFFLRSSDVVFDKASRTCTLRRRDMWRTSERTVRFDDIDDILIDVISDNTTVLVSCRLALKTRTGEVPFSASYEPGLERFEEMRGSIVDLIFAGRAPPPVFDPVKSLAIAGRLIDATKLLRQRSNLSLADARDEVMRLSGGRAEEPSR